ncbi:hypothetical protein QC756_30470 (plasmid) [Sinorhizobium meliloti]|nr:hypothetical protein [Sinorhizobium meliloti]WGI79026.1 hypothetical protein QC756_30470 [Sinorhizobium meliloti]
MSVNTMCGYLPQVFWSEYCPDVTFLKQLFAFGLAAVILQLPQHAALAADPCKGVDTKLSATRKADYSRLVAKGLDQKANRPRSASSVLCRPAHGRLYMPMSRLLTQAIFFFDSSSGKPVLKEVWGGIAEKSDEPEIGKWARDLGANKMIASCFADTVSG